MKQLDLLEGMDSRFESRHEFHKSTLAIVEKCLAVLDQMSEITFAIPTQLPLFSKLFHPGFGRVMEV